MQDRLVRVVKVGGSLFEVPRLAPTLRNWLAEQPFARNVLIAGGGKLANAIREADQRFLLGEETSHWLCIDVLRVTARLLAGVLPETRLLTVSAQLEATLAEADAAETVVFCPEDFMHNDQSLPHSWSVTTDSIAARIAEVFRADELVLLKSSEPPDAPDEMRGYVDECFPIAARAVKKIRFVNLKAWMASG